IAPSLGEPGSSSNLPGIWLKKLERHWCGPTRPRPCPGSLNELQCCSNETESAAGPFSCSRNFPSHFCHCPLPIATREEWFAGGFGKAGGDPGRKSARS